MRAANVYISNCRSVCVLIRANATDFASTSLYADSFYAALYFNYYRGFPQTDTVEYIALRIARSSAITVIQSGLFLSALYVARRSITALLLRRRPFPFNPDFTFLTSHTFVLYFEKKKLARKFYA